MPRVSVIMACFNASAYLKRSVSSVQYQTMSDWELLIVDDASTDDTQIVAEALAAADPRVKYMRSSVNQGPSASRNTAIAHAVGEWIAILDADDAYLPMRLEQLVDAGRQSDMVFDNLVLWDDEAQSETGFLIPPDATPSTKFTLADLIASEHPSCKWRFGFLKPLVRREFLSQQRLRYDERLRLAEDFDLYARALLAGGQAMIVKSALYLYTTQIGQQSGTRSQGTRTIFDYRSRVALADRLIADHVDARPDDIVWLQRYKEWQTLYADALDIAAARKQWSLGLIIRIASGNPRAFLRFLITSRWLSPLLRRRQRAQWTNNVKVS